MNGIKGNKQEAMKYWRLVTVALDRAKQWLRHRESDLVVEEHRHCPSVAQQKGAGSKHPDLSFLSWGLLRGPPIA